jgi:hypothetical protein
LIAFPSKKLTQPDPKPGIAQVDESPPDVAPKI